jgi:DNA-binding NarL/FixJ family response regulator
MAATVLIVDDHPSFRAAARRLLEIEGYDVVGEVADGESALRAVKELRPDFVLLDVQLPDLNGFEVCESLADDPYAPAIVLTSSRDQSDYGPCIERAAAAGFVSKAELSGPRIAAILPA